MNKSNSEKDLCALYLRLSDEDRNKEFKDDDSESIKNQKMLLIDFALQQGFEVYNIYSDDDYSGADSNRPAYNQLLKDAEDGKFNIVVCKTQARFTRDMEHVEKYIHNKFIEWGIRFIGVADRADTNDVANKKTRQIFGLTNEWYLEDLSDNIRTAFNAKKKAGHFIGAYPCYGYMRDEDDKNKLIIDEEVAPVIKKIFNLYIKGNGCYSIAKMLNAEHIPTPAMYKYQKGIFKTTQRKGVNSVPKNLWEGASVSYILHQRMYTGDMVQNKETTISYKNKKKVKNDKSNWIIVPNTHAPIISRNVFEKAQTVAGTRQKPDRNGTINIFTGIVKCGNCKGHMAKSKNGVRQTKKGETPTTNFSCKLRSRSKNACIGASITDKKLNEMVLYAINQKIISFNDGNLLNQELYIKESEKKQQISRYQKLQEELTQKIDLISKGITDLYLDKVKKVVTEEQFVEINSSLINEKNSCSKTLKEVGDKIIELERTEQNIININNIFSKYKKVDKLDRETVLDFISEIYVFNTNTVNEKRIEIEWRW